MKRLLDNPEFRRLLRAASLFFALMLAACWPSPVLRAHASEALATVLSPILASMTFGAGGHARVRAAPVTETRRPGENVTADAEVDLFVAGFAQVLPFGVSLRRDFYLPLAVFVAAVLAAPVKKRRRAAALMIGAPVAFYACFSGLYGTICWLFAHQAPAIYPLTDAQLRWLDTIVGTFLMPPTLRFFVPFLIALGTLSLLGGFGARAEH